MYHNYKQRIAFKLIDGFIEPFGNKEIASALHFNESFLMAIFFKHYVRVLYKFEPIVFLKVLMKVLILRMIGFLSMQSRGHN